VSRPIANLRSIAGNRTVEPCTRRRWPDLSESRPLQYSVDLRRTSKKSFAVFLLQRFPIDGYPATDAFRKWDSSDSRNATAVKWASYHPPATDYPL
jgi:hypothetical protein